MNQKKAGVSRFLLDHRMIVNQTQPARSLIENELFANQHGAAVHFDDC